MNTDTCTVSLMFCNVLLTCLFNIYSLLEQNEGVNECFVKLIKIFKIDCFICCLSFNTLILFSFIYSVGRNCVKKSTHQLGVGHF